MKYIKNVLVIDDNEIEAMALVEFLTAHGFRVGLAPDGESAIETILEKEIDLVIMDLLLPDISGISLVKKLKAAQPDTEILVKTSLQDLELVNTAMLNGASGFITKPIDPHQVLFLSLKCLERRWLRKECSRLMLEIAISEHKYNELKERINITS